MRVSNSTNDSKRTEDDMNSNGIRYEADGKTVLLRPGDSWKVAARSGSGWYTKHYEVRSIGEDGISYTVRFEGNHLNRHSEDPTLFGTTPVEKGDAQYLDPATE